MECTSAKFKKHCTCTYEPCSRKQKCCECLHYHREAGELPACFFDKEAESTYNRSIAYFIRTRPDAANK